MKTRQLLGAAILIVIGLLLGEIASRTFDYVEAELAQAE